MLLTWKKLSIFGHSLRSLVTRIDILGAFKGSCTLLRDIFVCFLAQKMFKLQYISYCMILFILRLLTYLLRNTCIYYCYPNNFCKSYWCLSNYTRQEWPTVPIMSHTVDKKNSAMGMSQLQNTINSYRLPTDRPRPFTKKQDHDVGSICNLVQAFDSSNSPMAPIDEMAT